MSFDETVTARFDKYAYAYVSASQSFSLEDISEVPTLRFDPQAEPDTGYFLLPEGVTNLSWAFYGESSVTGIGKLQGVIENVQPATTTYRMKFRFSKTPDGALSLTVLVEELPNERYDNIIFSPSLPSRATASSSARRSDCATRTYGSRSLRSRSWPPCR